MKIYFRYELSDGTKREETGKFNDAGIWTVEGFYVFVAEDDGVKYRVNYIADDQG